MTETPRSLLVRLADSSSEADWRRLVEIYQPFLFQWLAQALIPESDRADLAQAVLMAVVKEMPNFQHSDHVGAFRRWLRMMVVNRVRHYWRTKHTRENMVSSESVLDQLADPASGLSGQWDREHDTFVLNRLLGALESEFAPTTWAAFRKHVIEGHASAEVAKQLDVSVNVVLLAKSRVLRRLREEAKGLINPH